MAVPEYRDEVSIISRSLNSHPASHFQRGDRLPKSSPKVMSIEPGIQHPAVEPTKAALFADDPYTISADALVTVPLSIADFHRYEDDIAAYVHKRFDYDPETQEITFRMPTPTHDMFAEYVKDAILKELSKLDEGYSSFIAGIQTVGNARIKLAPNPNAVGASGSDTESKGQQKGPDLQFMHELTDISTVIIEVAYTQNAKELPRLAHEYIAGSGGMIKVVVGLDIKPNKQSTISIWRSRIALNEATGRERVHIDHFVDSDPFRTADKAPVNETKSLKLYLDDFTFDEFSIATYKDVGISISYGTLCHFLDKSEELRERLEAAEVVEKRIALCRMREISPIPPRSPPEPK